MRHPDRREALGFSGIALAAVNGLAAGAASAAATKDAPDLSGKTVLVISSETKISRAIREMFSAAGATVNIKSQPTEFTDEAYAALFRGVPKTDMVIAIAIPERNGPVGKVSLADFHKVLVDNYGRMWLTMKSGILMLRGMGGGQFLGITSTDGRSGVPNGAAASAAANGITIMLRSATLECAQKQDGVRVNCIQAGTIVDSKSPRPGEVRADDVASAAAYLAADGSVYLTGVVMPVDNGGSAT